ncbi:MAG: MFS transporter [Bryobacterales bacterium]|nr:MFS transporter [Bryobacterales bacterium]
MSFRTRAWVTVGLLWVAGMLNYLDRQVIFSVIPLIRRDVPLTDVEVGLLGTLFFWVYAVCSPVAGFLADRFGRKRVIVFSLCVWSAVTWLTGHARTREELLAARALMGISEACYLPAALALIAAYHSGSTRSKATGLNFSGIYAGIVIGGVGGGWMGEHYGWRFVFTLLGVVGVAYSAMMFFALKEPAGAHEKRHETPFLGAARQVWTLRGFPVLLGVFAAASVGNSIVYTWLPLYLYERFGMTLAEAGFAATFWVQAASFGGILLGGWLADRWARTSTRGRVRTQALGMLAAAPFLFLTGSTSLVPFLVAGLVVFGVGRGMFDSNAMPVLCQLAKPELRATGYGILNMAGTVTSGVTALAAGAMKSRIGIGGSLEVAAVILLVSAVFLWRMEVGGTGESIRE